MVKSRILMLIVALISLQGVVGAQAQESATVNVMAPQLDSKAKFESIQNRDYFIAPYVRIYPEVSRSFAQESNIIPKPLNGLLPFIDSVTTRVLQGIIPSSPELLPSVTIHRLKVGEPLPGQATNYYYSIQLEFKFCM